MVWVSVVLAVFWIQKRLPIDTHLAMQQRKALTTLTGSGEAFRFHQQSRVFGEPTDGILKKAPPRSTVRLLA